ncbi:Membrane protein [Gammaproteobacteria bacterium]
MSEHGFHVHGAHDHEVEHQAQSGPGLAQQIAIFTAILSTLGAVISYQGGDTQNLAMLYKNEAVLQKSHASDQWSYYQAKSTKGQLMEMAAMVAPPEKQEYYKQQIERYAREKEEIKAKAEEFDQKSEEANHESDHHMHPHHSLAQSMTFIQIAISLASITVLTRKRWLFVLGGVAALAGVVLWAMAWWWV